MSHGEKLYEGKAKILYATDDPTLVTQYFKDDATAFNAQKRGTIVDKGVVNNRVSSAGACRPTSSSSSTSARCSSGGLRSSPWRSRSATSPPAGWRSALASRR